MWDDNFPQGAVDHLTKIPKPGIRNILSSCWSVKFKRLPKQFRAIFVLDCLQELEGKYLMLKMLYISETEFWEIGGNWPGNFLSEDLFS